MSVLTPPMSSPASLKRSYADSDLDGQLRDKITPTSSAGIQAPASNQTCSPSPSPANLLMSTSSAASNISAAAAAGPPVVTAEMSNKRTKISFAEKEARQMEKQFKDQQLAEDKARKFAQKLFKDEQKRFKEVSTSSAASNISAAAAAGPPVVTAEMSNKRTKISFAEKEARQIEKQFKDQQQAEDKARRSAQKLFKDEERKKSKEEQAKVREAEKQRKLEEKQKVEEEKNKKVRVSHCKESGRVVSVMLTFLQSQLRLNAFFVQSSMPKGTPSASPTRDIASPLSSRRSSIAGIKEMELPQERSQSVSVTPQKAQLPDYERKFPPFFLQSHTVLAPHSRFSRDEKGLEYTQKKIDEGLGQRRESVGPFNAYDLLHLSSHSSHKFPRVHAVKDIIAKMHGSARSPIDLTESQPREAMQKSTDLLKTVPMKYLNFYEDYRPPYTGTFTKAQDRRAMSKLCRKPFSRELPKTDYDYDSEAEWEEPGEGEDLDSEGEEEVGEDEEENEMEGFLDDENDAVKKRPLLGDLEPTCSGICWEDLENEDSKLKNLDVLDLSRFKLDILMGKLYYSS